MGNTDRLKALLDVDEAGEQIAGLLCELLIDEDKRDILLIKLNEAKKQAPMLQQDVRLTKSEDTVRELVRSAGRPLSAKEITEMVPEYVPGLRHRSHASSVLNSPVAKGLLGKIPLGNVTYFGEPKEAVLEQLKRRGEAPEECSPDEITRETGLPLRSVLDTLKRMTG